MTAKSETLPRIAVQIPEIGSSMEVNQLRKINFSPIFDAFKMRRMDPKELNAFIAMDDKWKKTLIKLESFRAEKNRISKQISKAEEKEKEPLMIEAKEIDERRSKCEVENKEAESQRRNFLLALPNLVDSSVPLDDVKVVAHLGKPNVGKDGVAEFKTNYPGVGFNQIPKAISQYDIIKAYQLTDEERGAELAGMRFYYKINELVLLDLALSLYATKKLADRGFSLITPPYLVKKVVEEGATSLDAFTEALYKIEGEDLYLIPTAEHPIAAYNSNKTFNLKDLPIRYAGFSPAFRKEVGAHGKDTKGIYRNHHFNKVEQYVICAPDQVEAEFNLLVQNQVALLNDINIPVRVVVLPAWDMDKKAMIQADVEGWWPGQNKFGELGSHGYMGSWQAARLNVRYAAGNGKAPNPFVHTIYGTAIAIERTLACMLENSIDENGVIQVPKVLADYSGITEINPVKKK